MQGLNKQFLEKLNKEPVFCFTSDMDWAPESMIEETLALFRKYNMPVTPFLTGISDIVTKYYRDNRRRYVGVHPNFLSGSSHGASFKEIISSMRRIWPEAISFRSHSFFDNSLISNEFYKRGFKYDSNIYLHLQPNIRPLIHASGLIKFPVFLEDDFCISGEGPIEISRIHNILNTTGLKIFNFHPVHICLNTPDMNYYRKIKDKIKKENWKKFVYKRRGIRTFLTEILDFIRSSSGFNTFYLSDLYSYMITDHDRFST